MGEGLEAKVKKSGFFKRAALVAGASILSILSMGCSQIQYRARVQTKPPEEVKIYLDGKLAGKTSKKEPVYVESEPFNSFFNKSGKLLFGKCKISLKANKYEAFFIMNYQRDILDNKSKDKIKILDPKDRSQHCLEARATTWGKGPSYDFVFQIPKEFLKDLHTPEKRYTEWGDEIKEKPKEEIKIKEYIDPKKTGIRTEGTRKPSSLEEQVRTLQLSRERDVRAWNEFDKKGWIGPACLNLLVPGVGHFFYGSYALGAIHLGIDLALPLIATIDRANTRRTNLTTWRIVGIVMATHALECFFETIFVARSYNLRRFREKYPKVHIGFDPNEKSAFVGLSYKF